MQIHSLISSKYILPLHAEKNKMQPTQAKYGAEQFNHSLVLVFVFCFVFFLTQNTKQEQLCCKDWAWEGCTKS